MATRRKKKKTQQPAPHPSALQFNESRPAEWATIGWLLASLTTAACLAVWGCVRIAAFLAVEAGTLRQVAGFLLFAALAVGVANLALCAAAHRLRTVAPPQPLLWFSLIVGLLPMMLLWLT